LQWPVKPDGTDTPLLYRDGFPFADRKARAYPVQWTKPLDFEEQYDLHLNNGRLLEHFHEGNLTYKSKGISEKTPEVFLEVSPELAAERGLNDGTFVRLTSPFGNVKVKCIITARVKGNEVYLPMNDSGDGAVNYLTSSAADKDTDTPAYKDTRVKMEILQEEGINPLPRINFRYGNPQPQMGVQVQKKWARKDYVFPGDLVKERERSNG